VFKRKSVGWLLALWVVSSAAQLSAARIPVKYKEGVSHGFIVLRSKEGHTLAAGDMIQTVDGPRVTTEVVLHYRDGSLHDEVAEFSQEGEFQLLTDHLRQSGPSFPTPIDAYVTPSEGSVKVRTEKEGKTDEEER
jgi:hypothetical protein